MVAEAKRPHDPDKGIEGDGLAGGEPVSVLRETPASLARSAWEMFRLSGRRVPRASMMISLDAM